MEIKCIFDIGPINSSSEIFDKITSNSAVKIERIISTGQATPEGEWLDQEKSEFVLLVSGKAGLQIKGQEEIELKAGDHLLIPSQTQHRVTFTQKEPATIWLAVHF